MEEKWKVGDHVKLRAQPSFPFCFPPSAALARARPTDSIVASHVLCLF